MRREARATGRPLPRLRSGEVERMTYLAKNSNLTAEQMAGRFGVTPELARHVIAGNYRPRD